MTFRILCLLLACVTPLPGQEESATKKKNSGIQLTFMAETVPDKLGKVFLLTGETRTEAFELPSDYLSDPVQVAERVMILKTEQKEIPLSTINLPEDGKSFAIILLAAKPAASPAATSSSAPPAGSSTIYSAAI